MLIPLLLLSAAEWTQPAGGQPNRQPQLAAQGAHVAMAYGSGDSVFFTGSNDSGKTWGNSVLVSGSGKLSLGMRRGPRVAISNGTIVISAIVGAKGRGADGDLVAWRSADQGKTWSSGKSVNDVPGAAREGLHSMAAGGKNTLFATWLDLRSKGTKLYGSASFDGGSTWSPNRVVYESSSGSICECCHPTAVVETEGGIGVMFRNSLDGNRDMYLVRSSDGGKTFAKAQKLGSGTWKLNACPMDGGDLVLPSKAESLSVWRREGNLYFSHGKDEVLLGLGKQPVIVETSKGAVVAWTEGKAIHWKYAKDEAVNTLPDQGAFVSLVALADGGVLIAAERDGAIFAQRLN